jgi:hypothetical protein
LIAGDVDRCEFGVGDLRGPRWPAERNEAPRLERLSMSRLEITRLDSPLARSTRGPRDPVEEEQPHEQREAASRPKRRPPAEPSKPRLASVPQATVDATAASPDSLDGLLVTPALDETLELLSTRLPTSLRRSLSELTGALRARDGQRVSQKALPEQEVLAVIIWLAGSAQEPESRDDR